MVDIHSKEENKEEEEEEEFTLESFFTDTSYTQHTFTYGGVSFPFQALAATTTDYDLTGQVVWPACQLLARYIVDHASDSVQGHTVLEMGAGVGVAGMAASLFATRTVLTDHNDVVLDVLRRNVDHLAGSLMSQGTRITACRLEWGNTEEEDVVLGERDGNKSYSFNTMENNNNNNSTGYDVILGADVVYWPSVLESLFTSAYRLLAADGVFYLSYVSRANSVDRNMNQVARKLFNIETVDVSEYDAPELGVESIHAIRLFRLRKRKNTSTY